MLLQVEAVSRYFKLARGRMLHAVDEVSFNVDGGEIVGIVGESGSGKSTLGRLLVGLGSPNSGQIRYNGTVLPREYSARDRLRMASEIQMIFQDTRGSLSPRLTAVEVVAEGLIIRGENRLNAHNTARSWLAKVGLDHSLAERYPHELSGGQRQRLGIARALAVEPQLLVCDEPVSALDVSVQAQIINLLYEISQSQNLAMVFIAHDLSLVQLLCDRVVVMYMGKVMEQGDAATVFRQPGHPYTQALVSSSPQVRQIEDSTAQNHQPIPGEVQAPINPVAACRFADRCSKAEAKCHSQPPPMIALSEQQSVACHLV
ncbi:MAG: ABC transporter ATP-binding protein [Pseudomonadales bacterium]